MREHDLDGRRHIGRQGDRRWPERPAEMLATASAPDDHVKLTGQSLGPVSWSSRVILSPFCVDYLLARLELAYKAKAPPPQRCL